MDAQRSAAPVVREDRLHYTPYPGSVRLARRRAARLVTEWGHGSIADDVALTVSELAGNALLHGCLPGRYFRVHLMLTTSALRIEVTDPRGERQPRQREVADGEMYGRGLLIVDHLAARWGVIPHTVGKTVWAELPLG
ncbi:MULTISPECIES: ATP-binding protein [Streptomyces]|uniref:ATP-binding protein n=1 Tax=Streptomyces TaxID=1883 RepID=UPI0022496889|nr:ATP-binding protein [Streptomyces sp. JHD 1]MCX2971536.1 ATP-binding protein [Streptomyces sp. JHD 1]